MDNNKPVTSFAFDLYASLVDTHSLTHSLAKILEKNSTEPEKLETQALRFSEMWRQKQLEYTFRRSLMQHYVDFDLCTSQALEYCYEQFDLAINRDQSQQLMQQYQELPAFDDCRALSVISQQVACFIFTNGVKKTVAKVLENAKIKHYFRGIISADEIQVYKPSPLIYQHFSQQTNTPIEDCYLVSGNSFDLLGASCAGMKTIWLKRQANHNLDPWHITPHHIITSLEELEPMVQNIVKKRADSQ